MFHVWNLERQPRPDLDHASPEEWSNELLHCGVEFALMSHNSHILETMCVMWERMLNDMGIFVSWEQTEHRVVVSRDEVRPWTYTRVDKGHWAYARVIGRRIESEDHTWRTQSANDASTWQARLRFAQLSTLSTPVVTES